MQDGRPAGIEKNGMEGTLLRETDCAVVDDPLDSGGDGNAANGMHNGINHDEKRTGREPPSRRLQAKVTEPDSHLETNGRLSTGATEPHANVMNGAEELGSSDPMALLHDESRDKFPVNGDVAEKVVLHPAGIPLKRTTGQIEGYTDDQIRQQPSNVPPRRDRSLSPGRDKDGKVLKLSPAKIHELTSSPDSLCLRTIPGNRDRRQTIALPQPVLPPPSYERGDDALDASMGNGVDGTSDVNGGRKILKRRKPSGGKYVHLDEPPEFLGPPKSTAPGRLRQPKFRAVSSPGSSRRRKTSPNLADRQLPTLNPLLPKRDRGRTASRLHLEGGKADQDASPAAVPPTAPSPVPMSIPLPPFSLPTYLQLELSSERPSPLYIHQSATKDFPYESSLAKLERLRNFLLLPPLLEQVLWFGTLACLDSWLYSFTIFPLRFGKSVSILLQSWFTNLGAEARFISRFVVTGVGRVWRRRRGSTMSSNIQNGHLAGPESAKSSPLTTNPPTDKLSNSVADRETRDHGESGRRRRGSTARHHRRTKSVPSSLMPHDKADILKGTLMISTCIILMYFDASRVYHWIRGQAAIKLYVIYNVLEVSDAESFSI